MIQSAGLRRKLQEYRAELYARVLRVRCPLCKAPPRCKCKDPHGREYRGAQSHGHRHNEAARVGLLRRKWYDDPGWTNLPGRRTGRRLSSEAAAVRRTS